MDLHPKGFAVSSAGLIYKDGTFFLSGREGKPKRNKWSLFMIDSDSAATLVYRWKEVRRFARKSGCRNQEKARPLAQGLNKRGEVAGLLLCKGNPSRHFFYSPERGLELMQNLLDEAG